MKSVAASAVTDRDTHTEYRNPVAYARRGLINIDQSTHIAPRPQLPASAYIVKGRLVRNQNRSYNYTGKVFPTTTYQSCVNEKLNNARKWKKHHTDLSPSIVNLL